MNKVILIGNLVRDPELRATQSGISVCSFRIAVNRRYKDQNGEYPTDFIDCVAWRNSAEFISKYFHKGKPILVVGNLQTRNYEDKEGVRRYVTEVAVDEVEFVGGKAEPSVATKIDPARDRQFMADMTSDETSLPFDI